LYALRQNLRKKVSKGIAGVNLTAAIETGLKVSEKGLKQNEVRKAATRKQQPSQKSLSSVLNPATSSQRPVLSSRPDATMPSTSMVQDEFFPGANESTIDWPEQTTSMPFVNQSAWSMPTLNSPFPPVASQQTQTRGPPWPHYQQVQYTLYGQSASQSATLNSHPLQTTPNFTDPSFLHSTVPGFQSEQSSLQLTGSVHSTFQPPSTASQQVPQPLSGVPWHSGMSPYPYTLCARPKAVRKCYGCGEDFAQKYRTEPNNIIVKHVDRRLKGRNNQTS